MEYVSVLICFELQGAVDAHEKSLESAQRYYGMYQEEQRKLNELQVMLQEKEIRLRDMEQENQGLQKQLAESRTALSSMKKMMVLAGHQEAKPLDSDITSRFFSLKSDILQLVRDHLNSNALPKGIRLENVAPELPELVMRSKIANSLWKYFFDPQNLLFGLDDSLEDNKDNTLKKVEEAFLRTRQPSKSTAPPIPMWCFVPN